MKLKNKIDWPYIKIAASLILCCYFSFWLAGTVSPFIFFNSSLFGVLIGAAAMLILPTYKKRILCFGFIIAVFTSIVLTGSRVGLLAWIVYVFLLCWFNGLFKGVKQKTLLSVTALSFSILFFALVFLFKTSSTQGRLFIWQNCFTIIKKNWVTGVGIGQFRIAYNNQQANWFVQNGFKHKETMLADTVYYAFNEWLQLTVEIGLPLTIAILLVIVYVFIRAFKNVQKQDQSFACKKAVAAFGALLFSTFFSYPFFYLPTFILFLILFCYIIRIANFPFIERMPALPKKIISGGVFILITAFIISQLYARVQWKEANELQRIAYKKMALDKMKRAYPFLKSNGDYLYSLAGIYSLLNKTDSAIIFLQQSAVTKNDYELHRKLGQLYMETGHQRLAEEHFLKAVYMVPNRFRSREMLVDFYFITGNSTEARFWAEQSLQLTEKVPSLVTDQIRERMKKYLTKSVW